MTRYIYCNPIETRSPLVKRLADYPWPSYPAYIDRAPPRPWLYKQETYGLLGGKTKRYKHYVEDHPSDPDIIAFYRAGRVSPVLGDEVFKSNSITVTTNRPTPASLSRSVFPAAGWSSFGRRFDDGNLLPLVDVPAGRMDDLRQRVARLHPEVRYGGVQPGMPVFP